MIQAFDYIICGAGSAGCVLANKLSADPDTNVLLLEAGPMDRNLMIHIPAGVYSVYRDPKINWNYFSEEEAALDNRQVFTPRGRVVGGSSSINSMVYMRGHPRDYDRWASDFGLEDWSFDQCLPYFKAGENSDRGADDWRGDDGPLGVTKGQLESALFDAFLEAGEQSGQGVSDDLNGYQPEGVARLDATRKNGKRCSAAVAFLHPILTRKNLTVITGAQVHKIIIEGQVAKGITYQVGKEMISAYADREVILSGGAINSPHLLMLSGVGPADHLKQHEILPIHDLPGVGQNLQDHPTIILQVSCPEPVSIDWVQKPHRKLLAGAEWLLKKTGIATTNVWEAGGLVRGNADVPYPNLQYHYAPTAYHFDRDQMVLSQGFSIHIDQLRPTSRGQVELKSSDPLEKPAITFNYLQTEQDQKELIEGVRMARDLFKQSAYARYKGAELVPGDDVTSDTDILTFLRSATETDYHPCATCRMGSDEMAVVDGEMRVRGVENLRVVDASVMPQLVSANLNAPTQMIAARAADFILGNRQRASEKAHFHFEE